MRAAGMFLIALVFCCCGERDVQSKAGLPVADTVVQASTAVPEPAAGDTLMAERYANGSLYYLVLARDSGNCNELHQSFYRNGKLKSSGCQGHVENAEVSAGMSVGTWTYYDSLSGRLDSSIFYDNSVSSKAFILKKTFYQTAG